MNSALRKILLILNIVLVLATLGAYLAPKVEPGSSLILSLLGLGYPALILANIFAIIVWLFTEPKFAILSVATMLIGIGSCSRILNVSISDAPVEGSIKVATYNANFSKPVQFTPAAKKIEVEQAFSSYLKEHDGIEILCVQEHGEQSEAYLRRSMTFPYCHKIEGRTTAIYSKYPFINTGIVDFKSNNANTCIWADVQVGTELFRIYTTHLESNRHDGIVPDVIVENATENMNNSALLGIVKHYQKYSMDRLRQARLINEHAAEVKHPVVICGDLNDTPQSHVYTVAKGDRVDTFEEEGMGIGSTFGEKIPGLRIDHIFVDKSIEVLDHEISRSKFSDHYLVIAELSL